MPRPFGDVVVKSIRDEDGNAIGGLAPFTPGIVPFADGTGVLTEDAVFHFDPVAKILYPNNIQFPTTGGYLKTLPIGSSVRSRMYRADGAIISMFDMYDSGEIYIKSTNSTTLAFVGSLDFDPTLPNVSLRVGAGVPFIINNAAGIAFQLNDANITAFIPFLYRNPITTSAVTPFTLDPLIHKILTVTTGGIGFTVNLPDATLVPGQEFIVKKIDAGVGTCTVTPFGAQTIDGNANYVLASINKYVRVVSNGANWIITGNV